MSSTDAIGIACPRCGCRELRTTHTRRVRAGMIRRYKVCRHCGRRITTHEATTRAQAIGRV